MKKNKKVICIICARGGSKGLKNKNLRKILNKPLIYYPIKAAKDSKVIDKIIVTTDSKKIASTAKKYGAEVPFIRPKKLSGDLATTEDTLKHALITYEDIARQKFEICVFLTATDIFRNPAWIDESISRLVSRPELESVFVGAKTHKNFWEKDNNGDWIRLRDWMSEYASRQVRRTIVREDTGLACASRAWLWREGKRIGDKVDIITTDDDFTSIDIHHLEDLQLAEAALNIRKKGNEKK